MDMEKKGGNKKHIMTRRSGTISYGIRSCKLSDNKRDESIHDHENIPQDMVVDVLKRLPAKSLARFRCVCKTWSSLIRDPVFVQLHQSRSLTRPSITGFFISLSSSSPQYQKQLGRCFVVFGPEADGGKHALISSFIWPESPNHAIIIGIANGLACILDRRRIKDKYISISNLSTHETVAINSPPPDPLKIRSLYEHFLFGFDPLDNEYKIVRFCTHDKWQFEIFTLSTKRWRKINGEHYNVYEDEECYGFIEPICVGGIIYWIAFSGIEFEHLTLHSFQVHGEKFQQVAAPDFHGALHRRTRLIQIGGRLALLHNSAYGTGQTPDFEIEMWVLQDYQSKFNWIYKKIAIPLRPNIVRDPSIAGIIGDVEFLIMDDFLSKRLRLFKYDIDQGGTESLRCAKITLPPAIGKDEWKKGCGKYDYVAIRNHHQQHCRPYYGLSIFSFFHYPENILPLGEDG